jgi:hypothetical protein
MRKIFFFFLPVSNAKDSDADSDNNCAHDTMFCWFGGKDY